MSRHILTPKDPTTTNSVVIGWDRPLASFYAQVWPATDDHADTDNADDAGGPTVWLGALEQVTDLQIILDAVAPYADVPDDLVRTLLGELAASPVATMAQHNQVSHW